MPQSLEVQSDLWSPMPSANKPSYSTFEDLPSEVELYDGFNGLPVPANYVKLAKKDCLDKIDKIWWFRLNLPKNTKRNEPDSSWNWVQKFGEVRADAQGYMQAWGVETQHDGEVQGAILYRTDGRSMIDEDADGEPIPAVWVCYLATAPWNRDWLRSSGPGNYSGVGSALLRMAVAHSYFRQGGGRVNLASVDNPHTLNWYQDRGFVRRDSPEGERIILELPEEAARRHLKKWGLS